MAFTYPYAASPDIVRSNQKDAYFTSLLYEQVSSVVRRVYGSRFAHRVDNETRTSSELLYYILTTLVGNRTLGEEYCDVHQVEAATGQLPALGRRAGYILSAILLPYGLEKILPGLKTRLGVYLERKVRATATAAEADAAITKDGMTTLPASYHVQMYILQHLQTLTSTAPIYAISLALFYLSGTYYHLSKRLFGLRYIFSRKLAAHEQRAGFEVLGVLLILQMCVQGYMHIRETMASLQQEKSGTKTGQSGKDGSAANPLKETHADHLARITHTPRPVSAATDGGKRSKTTAEEDVPRYDLADPRTLAWLQPAQQRKCTLCLDAMQDPSLTTCGHMFCWTCIQDWVREKAECPLCRQAVLGQHILPLRG